MIDRKILILVIILSLVVIVGLTSVYFYVNDDNEVKSNITVNNTNNTTEINNEFSPEEKTIYNTPDDQLSSEELKQKYPHLSDSELFERFGERGPGGVGYTQEMVDEYNRQHAERNAEIEQQRQQSEQQNQGPEI